jgi:hypothetical protein
MGKSDINQFEECLRIISVRCDLRGELCLSCFKPFAILIASHGPAKWPADVFPVDFIRTIQGLSGNSLFTP